MGGAERVTATLAREAARSGLFSSVEIFVLCWDRSGTLDSLNLEEGISLHYTGAKSERGGLMPLFRILATSNWSFVFSSSTHLNAFASAMRRFGLLRTDRLVSRESTSIFDRDLGWHGILLRGLYAFYGQQNLIICQTARMRDSLNAHTRNRFSHVVEVISNPLPHSIIDQIQSETYPPNNVVENSVVWCGRFIEVKSPLLAIETLDRMHRRGLTNTKLMMIGDGPLRHATEVYANTLGLSSHVEFKGFVKNPIELMRTSRVGLVTSTIEGFPNVILEILSSGAVGVASTDCAGELTDLPAVVVVKDRNPDLLAEALETLLSARSPPQSLKQHLLKRHPEAFLFKVLGYN